MLTDGGVSDAVPPVDHYRHVPREDETDQREGLVHHGVVVEDRLGASGDNHNEHREEAYDGQKAQVVPGVPIRQHGVPATHNCLGEYNGEG